jgi:hypothetical protein
MDDLEGWTLKKNVWDKVKPLVPGFGIGNDPVRNAAQGIGEKATQAYGAVKQALTPEADQQRTNQQSQVQQQPKPPVVTKPRSVGNPQGEFGAIRTGNTVGWNENNKPQTLSSEDNSAGIQRVLQGLASGQHAGTVSYLPSAPALPSREAQAANVAAGGAYTDPGMHRAGMARLQAGLPYDEERYNQSVTASHQHQLEDKALKGNPAAAELLKLGIEGQKVQAAEQGQRGLRSYWDDKLGIDREELALKKELANRPAAPQLGTVKNQIPAGTDAKGNPVFMNVEEQTQNGQLLPGNDRKALAYRMAQQAAMRRVKQENGPMGIYGALGFGADEGAESSFFQEELAKILPQLGVFE